MGSSASSDPGLNTFQSVAGTDGGVSAQNTSAGVSYNILPNKSQTLYAYGNYWVDQAGTASVDCAASTGTLSQASGCTGGVDLCGQGLVGNTIGIANCN
jgi:hypothetical protein